MREILFRGKRADTGEWIEGYYVVLFRWTGDKNPTPAIQVADCYSFREIIPETVGQYTGLKDKNGKKIFEGDIIAYRKGCLAVSFDFASFGFLFEGCNGEEGYSHVIPFNDYENGIYIDRKTYQIDYEIVGNVFDNPELLNQ